MSLMPTKRQKGTQKPNQFCSRAKSYSDFFFLFCSPDLFCHFILELNTLNIPGPQCCLQWEAGSPAFLQDPMLPGSQEPPVPLSSIHPSFPSTTLGLGRGRRSPGASGCRAWRARWAHWLLWVSCEPRAAAIAKDPWYQCQPKKAHLGFDSLSSSVRGRERRVSGGCFP